ncbi:hypothetical protein Hanom_Chr12g01072061 [Helianthus anomalus]
MDFSSIRFSFHKGVNEPDRARLGSSLAQFEPTYLSSSSTCELNQKLEPARAILRIPNKIKARLKLYSVSLK